MGKFTEALKKADEHRAQLEPTILMESDRGDHERDAQHETREEKHSETILHVEPEPIKSSLKAGGAGSPRIYDKNLVVYHDPQSYEAEQFRMLRTNILFPSKSQTTPKTILVTSALPGEGKSFVSSNLAIAIAQNIDKHVMLIDCDMRRPAIHKIFGYDDVPGLSNYLVGEQPLSDLLIKVEDFHLSILPSGPQPSNPSELLSSNRMMALLREVRDRYNDRHVIIDSPPPHLTAESNALAKSVDGIIVVVRMEKTSQNLVLDLIAKFPEDKVLGIVANWLDRNATNLYGSAKYAQYGYYGSNRKN